MASEKLARADKLELLKLTGKTVGQEQLGKNMQTSKRPVFI